MLQERGGSSTLIKLLQLRLRQLEQDRQAIVHANFPAFREHVEDEDEKDDVASEAHAEQNKVQKVLDPHHHAPSSPSGGNDNVNKKAPNTNGDSSTSTSTAVSDGSHHRPGHHSHHSYYHHHHHYPQPDRYYCSHLVADLLIKAGVLHGDRSDSANFSRADFSSGAWTPTLLLDADYNFTPDIVIQVRWQI